MSEQLFHVGIKALVRNKRGEILLVGSQDKTSGQSRLDLPGGRMEPGETLLQTLDRELREEIGVSYVGEPTQYVATLSRIRIASPKGARGLVLVVYLVTLESEAFTLGSEEDTYAWLEPYEAAKALGSKYDELFCRQISAIGEDR